MSEYDPNHPWDGYCAWFAHCFELATGMTPHPILANVPTCDSCHKFATGEQRFHPIGFAAAQRRKGKK